MFRRDRPLSRQGGWVIFFVSNEQPAKRRNDLEYPERELLWLEIRPNPLRSWMRRRHPLLVGCCYRPPNSTNEFFEHLESVSDKITDMDMILLGDFNAKHQEWFTEDPTNAHSADLKDLMDRFNMSQLCYQPTHLNSEGVPASLLDLVFTNIPDLLSPLVDVMAPIGRSDHLPVVVQNAPLQLKHPRCNFITPWSSNCQNEVAFPSTGRRKEVGCILAWKLDTRVCRERRYQRNLETLEGTVLSRHQIIHWARN